MTPILHFERSERGSAREVVRLGAVTIGEVAPVHLRNAVAAYALWLPDMRRAFTPAESWFAARSAVQRAVDEWLLRIGVFCPGDGVELRVPEDDAEMRERRRA
jgi:hypothetical protein